MKYQLFEVGMVEEIETVITKEPFIEVVDVLIAERDQQGEEIQVFKPMKRESFREVRLEVSKMVRGNEMVMVASSVNIEDIATIIHNPINSERQFHVEQTNGSTASVIPLESFKKGK
jgi:hypothetical protein